MALFSNKKEKATVRRASYQTGLLSAVGLEAVESQKARAQAGEQAASSIWGRLGAPGTFDTPTTAVTPIDPASVYDTTGPLSQKSKEAQGLLSKYTRLEKDAQGNVIGPGSKNPNKYGSGAEALFDPREGILDPEKYSEMVGQSAAFRIQSRQTAEAEQLLKQEGPMWDMLNNSTIGRIYEGAAIQNKEALREIRNGLAKGGTARRTAFAQAQQLIQMEKAHQGRVQQTWTANLALHDYIRKNADRVQDSNIKFLDNLPELRESYNKTMTALTSMLTGQVVPYAMQGIDRAASSVAAVQAKDGAFLEGLIQAGAAAVIGAAFGGVNTAMEGGESNITSAFTNMQPTSFQGGGAGEYSFPDYSSGSSASKESGIDWKGIAKGAFSGAAGSLVKR